MRTNGSCCGPICLPAPRRRRRWICFRGISKNLLRQPMRPAISGLRRLGVSADRQTLLRRRTTASSEFPATPYSRTAALLGPTLSPATIGRSLRFLGMPLSHRELAEIIESKVDVARPARHRRSYMQDGTIPVYRRRDSYFNKNRCKRSIPTRILSALAA